MRKFLRAPLRMQRRREASASTPRASGEATLPPTSACSAALATAFTRRTTMVRRSSRPASSSAAQARLQRDRHSPGRHDDFRRRKWSAARPRACQVVRRHSRWLMFSRRSHTSRGDRSATARCPRLGIVGAVDERRGPPGQPAGRGSLEDSFASGSGSAWRSRARVRGWVCGRRGFLGGGGLPRGGRSRRR